MRLRCKPGGSGRISWECCTSITERPLWGEGGEIFPALPRTPHRCSLIPLPAVFISSFFEFLHLAAWGIGRGGVGEGWDRGEGFVGGPRCVVEEHEHAEMEGCELNMYVLSALLCHSGGTLAFCGVCVFAWACVCACARACVSQSGLSHISRGHLPRFSAE